MRDTVTMTLTEFLLARIAEDEESLPCETCGRPVEPDGPREDGEFGHVAAALPYGDPVAEEFWADPCPSPEPTRRSLAECEAKRRVIERHPVQHWGGRAGDLCAECAGGQPFPCYTLRALAGVYADHQDYREEWAL